MQGVRTPEARDDAGLPREVGGFRLLRTLGRGGMGVVYEAEELASGRRVALKVLAQELLVSDEAFERFRREARIAASISDTSCVFVFGAHQIDTAPAIAMELCPGETLEHRLAARDPIPIQDAVRWTIGILDGLEAAHRAGIVHRDVKPSNCFITAAGRVKVGDFGLARSLERDLQLTRSGVFLGSPLYASPEQVRGRQVDLRSDLYSVGATLYALLTGRPPFQGENLGEVLARILSESPEPPSRLRNEIPRGLDKVVLRALSREPAQRFATHAEMREALREFLGESRAPAGPVRRFLAYLADGGFLSLLNLPLIALWTRSDPQAFQTIPGQPWRLQSTALMLILASVGCVYFAVFEGLFGRTIGKWLTGQRVVLVGNVERPALHRVLRALVWSTPGLLSLALGFVIEGSPAWVRSAFETGIAPFFGVAVMLSTMRRGNGWRGVHEFVSRTRVVVEPLPFARFVRQKVPPATRLESSDLLPARLGAYAVVGRVGRTTSGKILEANDTSLDRRVWILVRESTAAPLAVERRSLDHATSLRWLDGFEEHGARHEVFEAPGGARLEDCCANEGRLAWPMAHALLSNLATELDRDPPVRLSLDQLWIDRSWNLRILDEPLGEGHSPDRAPLELLALAANASLGVAPGSGVELPLDLPEHAEPTARRLLGLAAPFSTVAEARSSLAECSGRPQGITRKARGLQILVGSGAWMMICFFCLFSTRVLVVPEAREMRKSEAILQELLAGRRMTAANLAVRNGTPTGAEIDADGLRARSILVAQLADVLERPRARVTLELSPEDKAFVARMKEQHGQATRAEIDAARARVEAERLPDRDFDAASGVQMFRELNYWLPFLFVVLWAATAILGAWIVRGGFSLRMMSLAVRDAKGRRAGRMRCAWRALLSASPLLVAYLVPVVLMSSRQLAAATVFLVFALAVHLVLIAVSLRTPDRGWQDRLARTRLVPR